MTAIHQPLLAEIGVAQEHIDGLGHELSAVDAELDALAAQREQYRLLEEACTTLESLAALGAGQAFWGSHADQDAAAGHLREVRARLAGGENVGGAFNPRVELEVMRRIGRTRR